MPRLYAHLRKVQLMNGANSSSISISISQPARLLGMIWTALGFMLLVAFFLPNFTMAGMGVSGPKLIEMVTRPDFNPNRILDDEGFFMMVTVPILSAILAIVTLTFGLIAAIQNRAKGTMLILIFASITFIYAILGAIIVYNSNHDVPFFAKLLPKPAAAYWFAIVLHALICVAGLGFTLLRRGGIDPNMNVAALQD